MENVGNTPEDILRKHIGIGMSEKEYDRWVYKNGYTDFINASLSAIREYGVEMAKLAFSEGYDSAMHYENLDKIWREFQKEHKLTKNNKQ